MTTTTQLDPTTTVQPATSEGGDGAGPATPDSPPAPPEPRIPHCIPPRMHEAYRNAVPTYDPAVAARTPLYLRIFEGAHRITDHFKIADALGLTPKEFLDLLESPPYQDFAKRYQALQEQHLHQHALLNAQQAIDALVRLTRSDKPEVARRAATTILTLAGQLPAKSPAPKPWEKVGPTPSSAFPATLDLKPGSSACRGPETPNPPEPSTPATNSAFSIQNSAFSPTTLSVPRCKLTLPTSPKSRLTKQHTLTYTLAVIPEDGTETPPPSYRIHCRSYAAPTTISTLLSFTSLSASNTSVTLAVPPSPEAIITKQHTPIYISSAPRITPFITTSCSKLSLYHHQLSLQNPISPP